MEGGVQLVIECVCRFQSELLPSHAEGNSCEHILRM